MNIGITPVTALQITPTVYIDVDVEVSDGGADEAVFEDSVAPYPGLLVLMITAHGPVGGRPVYRVQGPLPTLIRWLQNSYNRDDPREALRNLESVLLAR